MSGPQRHIQPSDFRVGQPAPGDVVTLHGTKLLTAGTIVTQQHLEALRALEPGTARIRPPSTIRSSSNTFQNIADELASTEPLDLDVPSYRAATIRRRGRELEAELHAFGDRIPKPIPSSQPDVRFDESDARSAADGGLDERRSLRLSSVRHWHRHVIAGDTSPSHTAGIALDLADELTHHARRHTASLATLVLPRVTDNLSTSPADFADLASSFSRTGNPPIPWLHRLSVQAWATAGLAAGIAAAQGLSQSWVRIAALAGLFADTGFGVLPGFGVRTPDGSNWATARRPLTDVETNRMREHPSASLGLAEPILRAARIADDECWAALLAIAQHHERPDGTGFPRGERSNTNTTTGTGTASTGADRIHTISAAIAIADAFAGAWATRQYRPPNEPRTLAQTFVELADRGALDRAGVRALAEVVGRVPVGSRLRRSDGVVVRVIAPMGAGKMAVQAMAA